MNKELNTSEISPEMVYKRIINKNPFHIIDVRSTDSFKDWKIHNSVNIPFSIFNEGNFDKNTLETMNEPYVVVCNRGNDSQIIAKYLRDLNVPAISMIGGMKAWNTILHPVKLSDSENDIQVIQFQRLAKGCLSYLVTYKDEAVIIDPVFTIKPYLEYLEKENLQLISIFDSHLHADHVSGARILQTQTGANLYLSRHDKFQFEYKPIDYKLKYEIGGNSLLKPIHTPGHTKGSTCFKIDDKYMITGDTIFVDSIGRPDLANKAMEFAQDFYQTLQTEVLPLSDQFVVLPAHHRLVEEVHLTNGIQTNLKLVKEFSLLNLPKESFIHSLVNRSLSIPAPKIYQTIIEINKGNNVNLIKNIPELEMGGNKCAVSQ